MTLDGSASTDKEGDLLSYNWTLTSQPPGSAVTLLQNDKVQVTFIPSEPGEYIIELHVSDSASTTSDTAVITAKDKPESPSITPAGGYYSAPLSCSLTAEGGNSIYYTTDGSTPDGTALHYTAPFNIAADTFVQAVCIDSLGNISELNSVHYYIDPLAPDEPVFSPDEGYYPDAVSCTLSAEDYSTIHYRIDGGNPDESSMIYSGPIDIDSHTLVTAICIDRAGNRSSVSSAQYYIGDSADFFVDEIFLGTGWFSDENAGTAGGTVSLLMAVSNRSDSPITNQTVTMNFYLSEDNNIEPSDTQFFTAVQTITLEPGEKTTLGISNMGATLPSTLEEGMYYVGCIADINGNSSVSSGDALDEFFITNGDNAGPSGAFKIVNSWGVYSSSTWENVHDGHYWIDFESAKSLCLPVFYYFNNFTDVYQPSLLAVFNVTYGSRDGCVIRLVLGDPDNPVREKIFQSNYSGNIYSGSESFPVGNMALDITEFLPDLYDYPLSLIADTTGQTETGTLNSFTVEYYSDYELPPVETAVGSTGTIGTDGTYQFSLDSDAFSSIVFPEMTQTRVSPEGLSLVMESPDSSERTRDMALIGVYNPAKDYNRIFEGRFGTGLRPPSREEWASMEKLRSFSSGVTYGTLPEQVDNSASKYFPPIGNQGREGSCTAFSMGYYIQTYTEAREHDWDLSSVTWNYSSYPGEPGSELDKIISPDFLYHQINRGETGSSAYIASRFIIDVGGSSWALMPYSDEDDMNQSYPWPTEDAYREAPLFRGRAIGNSYWDRPNGYFILETDDDISLLKQLLAAGYCVSTSIGASELYSLFTDQDVVSSYEGGPMETDHAQTIVGYKEQSLWNPEDPDN
ncbi:MAG: chitobiase/beta-hexosaminidase C-terminal domain-containing protein [Spirochaetales bacterium]|nr:chitobiase/beta-hexosaminidase C-terminal domain-containing protein [Spirochaetales bacterium]